MECFVDCLYTGDIEKMDKGTFREVNKMAKVFDVAWLTGRCFGFFKDLVDGMSGSYEDILYLFQEASYVCITLKERGMINLTLAKIGSNTDCKTLFLRKFLEDITDVSASQLDLVVELAGRDLGIVVQSLTGKLKTHLAEQGAVMSDIFRHFLGTSDLRICRTYHKAAFDELFDVLEECSVDDLRWVLALHRRSSEEVPKEEDIPKEVPTQSGEIQLNPVAEKYPAFLKMKIPNIDKTRSNFGYLNFENFILKIVADEEVTNMLMIAEAVWRYVDMHQLKHLLVSQWLKDRLIAHMGKRKWNIKYVPVFFFESLYQPKLQLRTVIFDFFNDLGMMGNIAIADIGYPSVSNGVNFSCLRGRIPALLSISFQHGVKDCKQKGKCGLMLKINPKVVEQSIVHITENIELCTDNNMYPADLHVHDKTIEDFEKGHIHLLVGDNQNYYPVTPLYPGLKERYIEWNILNKINSQCYLRIVYR